MKKSKKDSKKISKKSKEHKEESKIEEEVEQAEEAITHRLRETQNNEEKEIQEREENESDFFEESIRQIPISSATRAPVLERIIQRDIPTPIIENQQQRQETTERPINYSPVSNEPNYGFVRDTEKDEKRYETNFVPPVLSTREISPRQMRQEFLRPQNETWANKTSEPSLDQIDFIQEEIKLPFEEKQKKYKRSKLR